MRQGTAHLVQQSTAPLVQYHYTETVTLKQGPTLPPLSSTSHGSRRMSALNDWQKRPAVPSVALTSLSRTCTRGQGGRVGKKAGEEGREAQLGDGGGGSTEHAACSRCAAAVYGEKERQNKEREPVEDLV